MLPYHVTTLLKKSEVRRIETFGKLPKTFMPPAKLMLFTWMVLGYLEWRLIRVTSKTTWNMKKVTDIFQQQLIILVTLDGQFH